MTKIKNENERPRKKGPFHKFFFLEKGKIRPYLTYLQETPDVKITDYFLRYMNYTLLWVPSVWISGNKTRKTYGLMLYGTTIIKKEGAEIFGNIMVSWANLFSNAPDNFSLNCGIDVKDVSGSFYTIEVERDEAVKSLRTLAEYANKVATEDFLLLHFGV